MRGDTNMKTTLFIGLTLAVATTANGQLFPERDPADVNGDGVITTAVGHRARAVPGPQRGH
jgi:hypothetical protein